MSVESVKQPRVHETRVLAVSNQKGGVGKTTTAINLGTALAAIGEKVLIVDMDPQGNASTGLGVPRETRRVTIYDVIVDGRPVDEAVGQFTPRAIARASGCQGLSRSASASGRVCHSGTNACHWDSRLRHGWRAARSPPGNATAGRPPSRSLRR